MVRSLWSAASGMIAQQTNVDTIANNLANVNSAGYKAEQAEFKSLLYQQLQTETTTANGASFTKAAPICLQVEIVSNIALSSTKINSHGFARLLAGLIRTIFCNCS